MTKILDGQQLHYTSHYRFIYIPCPPHQYKSLSMALWLRSLSSGNFCSTPQKCSPHKEHHWIHWDAEQEEQPVVLEWWELQTGMSVENYVSVFGNTGNQWHICNMVCERTALQVIPPTFWSWVGVYFITLGTQGTGIIQIPSGISLQFHGKVSCNISGVVV